MKPIIESYLKLLTFVNWDRFTLQNVDGWNVYTIYGWIDREKDSYKDFVIITVNEEKFNQHTLSFVTSSADKSLEIHQLLDMGAGEHVSCQRVEDYFTVPNTIKL